MPPSRRAILQAGLLLRRLHQWGQTRGLWHGKLFTGCWWAGAYFAVRSAGLSGWFCRRVARVMSFAPRSATLGRQALAGTMGVEATSRSTGPSIDRVASDMDEAGAFSLETATSVRPASTMPPNGKSPFVLPPVGQ